MQNQQQNKHPPPSYATQLWTELFLEIIPGALIQAQTLITLR